MRSPQKTYRAAGTPPGLPVEPRAVLAASHLPNYPIYRIHIIRRGYDAFQLSVNQDDFTARLLIWIESGLRDSCSPLFAPVCAKFHS